MKNSNKENKKKHVIAMKKSIKNSKNIKIKIDIFKNKMCLINLF